MKRFLFFFLTSHLGKKSIATGKGTNFFSDKNHIIHPQDTYQISSPLGPIRGKSGESCRPVTSPVSCDARPGCLGPPINSRASSTYHFACLQPPAAPQRQSWAGRSQDYHSDAGGRVLRGRPLHTGFVFAAMAFAKISCQCNQRYSQPRVSASLSNV